jgi:hypothetical protein
MTTAGDIIKGGASGAAARLAVGTNGQVLTVASGAPAWAAASEGGASYTAPPTSGWTWANQASAAVATVGDTLVFTDPIAGNTDVNNHVYYRAAPSTPWVLTAAFKLSALGIQFSNAGIGWRQSSDGKLLMVRQIWNSDWRVTVTTASSPTAEVSNIVATPLMALMDIMWLRISDDGTTRKAYVSADGENWVQIYSESRTTYLTGDQIMVHFDDRNASFALACKLYHWAIT